MKRFFICIWIALSLISPQSAFAGKTTTHIISGWDVVNILTDPNYSENYANQSITPEIKALIQSIPQDVKDAIVKNPKEFVSGALDGDIFYYSLRTDLAEMVHDKNPGDLVTAMLELAKTPQEKAYAYGWPLHQFPDYYRSGK